MSETTARSTTRSRENTRARLLDAAAEVFAGVGLDAASVEAVCDRAGFTRGAFYSNFESKDELFLELAARVTSERVNAVKARVKAWETNPSFAEGLLDPLQLVEQVLDIDGDDRLGILLMSEIRNHALRDPVLAAAYLKQDDEMVGSVTQIISDIVRAGLLKLRVPPEHVARMMLTTWESAAVRGAITGLDHEAMCAATSKEIARLAQLIIE
ncbi:MAG: TetR/AcrR family transcriptional regulator [Rhodoglobus sp.]